MKKDTTNVKLRHVVYKIVDPRKDNAIVYIGSGTTTRPRSSVVTSHVPWIRNNVSYLDLLVSDRLPKEFARYIEMRLIDKYRPRFNKVSIVLAKPKGLCFTKLAFSGTVNFRTEQQNTEAKEAQRRGSVIAGKKSALPSIEGVADMDRRMQTLRTQIKRASDKKDTTASRRSNDLATLRSQKLKLLREHGVVRNSI